MSFETDVRAVDEVIYRGYLDLVVNTYRPLFKRAADKAVEHMAREQVPIIKLNVHSGLEFRADGQFHTTSKPEAVVELRELPKIYQDESAYIAGCGDSRTHTTPSVQDAMRDALYDFRQKVQQSLASSI